MPQRPFPFKTAPMAHQRADLARSIRLRGFARLYEQGCGKSKASIDDTAYRRLTGQISAWIITAPNGVHTNWVADELPKHMPDPVAERMTVLHWDARTVYQDRSKAEAAGVEAGFTQRLKAALADTSRLTVLAHNIESVRTPYGAAVLKYMVTHAKTKWTVDEADDLVDPTSIQSKRVLALGREAVACEVLSGTLALGGPFGYYTPMLFLQPDIFTSNGLRLETWTKYQRFFAEFEQRTVGGRGGEGGRKIWQVAKHSDGTPRYRNLERLRALTEPLSSRVLKADVLDLPPKVYQKERFALTAEQRRMTKELIATYETGFANGERVTTESGGVRALRLHQIACGYVPVDIPPTVDPDTVEPERLIGDGLPRIDALLDAIRRVAGPTLIWTRFKMDVTLVTEALQREGLTWTRYDGGISAAEREANKRAYLAGEARCLVANIQSMSRGHTLVNTTHMIVYSHHNRVLYRVQGEDRAHRMGLDHPLLITDLIALGSVDEKIVRAHRQKQSVADILTGDPHKDWV